MISERAHRRVRSERPLLNAQRAPFPLACVQGLVVRGYNMAFTRYIALNVTDAGAAKAFIGGLVPTITTAAPWAQRPSSTLNVAFTYRGLGSLGIAPDAATLQSYFWTDGQADDHQPFVLGAAATAEAIGDVSVPTSQWRMDDGSFDVMLIVNAGALDVLESTAAALQSLAAGFEVFGTFDSQQLPFPNENGVYFGYQDGIAEPIVPGIPRDPDGKQVALDPGFFVLGTATGPALSVPVPGPPASQTLGRYGVFGSFRILEQDVPAFDAFLDANVPAFKTHFGITKDDVARAALMAMLVGRWPNGQPLVLYPINGDTLPPEPNPGEVNNFEYAATPGYAGKTDPTGTVCPFGSHVRRANPRIPGESASLHRIMRRAMTYQLPYDAGDRSTGEVGLMGLFMCASLKYQFDFVMQHWINGNDTLPIPTDVADPVIGTHPNPDTFTVRMPRPKPRWSMPISDFVFTRGSAYVFLPGIDGIRWIADPADTAIGSCAWPNV